MRPSEKSFNQVKAILGKLDRNIDQLRAQRRTPAPAPVPTPIPLTSAIGMGAVGPATPPAPTRPSSPFGRATPIPPVAN